MRHMFFDFAALTLLALGSCVAGDTTDAIAIGPVHTVTAEPGVLPPGTSFVVRTKETVNTAKAYRSTVYLASIAADILDQNGAVLIPKDSPVELAVRSVSYLGPGGAGMTSLTLAIEAIVARDVRYALETEAGRPGAGGIGINRGAAKWIGGSEEAARHVVTRGRRIHVPTGVLLGFRIQEPLRLRGYQRQ